MRLLHGLPSPLRGGIEGGGCELVSIERARQMRRDATIPERAIWRLLKTFRDQGFHFRRQVQIGKYYADIACHHAKLVIEVDGDTHAIGRGPEYDAQRDAFMRERGFEIIRFSNDDLMKNPEGVFSVIEKVLTEVTPTPDPSPQGGGEQKVVTND